MSIFDIFKTQWSAGNMTPEDRKKLFWYLRRKTSYTAWKRLADAFDRFAEIFEKQVREEPWVPGGMSGTDWQAHYPNIIRAQVNFEKGLERLLKGDRTVWLYNSLGVFDDTLTEWTYWHTVLVHHGPHMDIWLNGKYINELEAAIQAVFESYEDVGFIQPRMADIDAPLFWGEWMQCVLNNEAYPRTPVPGVTPLKSSLIVYPEPLPNVPIADKEILVKTGENVPVFGIYEPQVKDGCMNYLLGSVPAPTLEYEGSDDRPVTWRLIWEDKRYIDGEIPSEESRYFTDVNTAEPYVAPSVANDLLSAKTGELCPRSGNWAVLDDLDARKSLLKGKPMPQYAGRDVIWVWSPSR